MKDIYQLIEMLGSRTAMYTTEHKLSNIKSFIDGYSFALRSEDEKTEFISDFSGFQNWVAEKFGYRQYNVGWSLMILAAAMEHANQKVNWLDFAADANTENHIASVALFFDLVNEFKNA